MKEVWSGTLEVAGVDLQCHVLDDGRQIVETGNMQDLFEAWANGEKPADQHELDQMMAWLKAKNPGG